MIIRVGLINEKIKNMLNSNTIEILETIKVQINQEYGFHEGTPRINYGPCGVFSKIFHDKWNALFDKKVHICFVLTLDRQECDHIVLRLPSGELYDGGIGIHADDKYLDKFLLEDMVDYDELLLERWAYGLERTYPRFCPKFSREFVNDVISSNLEELKRKNIFNLKNIQLIDLTHTISSDIPHWGIDCGFQSTINRDYADCATETKFRVQHLSMYAGIGTHIDAPAHCIPSGSTISDVPIQDLFAPCVVIDVSNKAHEKYSMTENDILEHEQKHGKIKQGSFVIIYTGWDQLWIDPQKYRNNLVFPHVSVLAAELLVSRKIIGIGIDTLSPDCGNSDFSVHDLLLRNGVYIVENVANVRDLPFACAYVGIFPLKIKDGTESPVRLVGFKTSLEVLK